MAGTAVATLVLWLGRKRAAVLALWVAVGGSELFVWVGKWMVGRPRPSGAVSAVSSSAFPSGHAAVAVALYGFLAYVVARSARTRAGKCAAILAGIVFAGLLGFSRLYLGLHFITDVGGGYLIGGLWLMIAMTVEKWYRARVSAGECSGAEPLEPSVRSERVY